MFNLFKLFVCEHSFTHVRNIHGDEINRFFPIKRSEWKCTKCGKYEWRDTLHYGGETNE